MHAAAYALDPEFLETAGDLDEATQTGLLNVIEKMCLREAMLSCETLEEALLLKFDSEPVVSLVAQAELQLTAYQTNSGAFTRPSVQLNAKQMDPASWWAMYGKHLPLLQRIATSVLAQTGAASVAERNWSVYGRIRQQRPRLGNVVADKLVFAHESLSMQRKLQSAGYKVEVEHWESRSDSDSNASDEDDLSINALGNDAMLLRLMA